MKFHSDDRELGEFLFHELSSAAPMNCHLDGRERDEAHLTFVLRILLMSA